MKKLTILIVMLMTIGGCSNEVPGDQLIYRGGLYYEINSQTPFTGSAVEYYDNGQLSYKKKFKEGKQEGLTEWHYENGQLDYKWNYKDGKWDGLQESYYMNGQLIDKGNYKDGKKDGLFEAYHENGKLWLKENYKDGERID